MSEEPRVYVIPGVPRLVCESCGAKMRSGEARDGRCWKCQRPVADPQPPLTNEENPRIGEER